MHPRQLHVGAVAEQECSRIGSFAAAAAAPPKANHSSLIAARALAAIAIATGRHERRAAVCFLLVYMFFRTQCYHTRSPPRWLTGSSSATISRSYGPRYSWRVLPLQTEDVTVIRVRTRRDNDDVDIGIDTQSIQRFAEYRDRDEIAFVFKSRVATARWRCTHAWKHKGARGGGRKRRRERGCTGARLRGGASIRGLACEDVRLREGKSTDLRTISSTINAAIISSGMGSFFIRSWRYM